MSRLPIVLLALLALVVGCAAPPAVMPTAAPAPTAAVATPTTVAAPSPSPGSVSVICRDWRAWHDSTPGAEPTLHLVGTCDLPTPGHAVELRRKEPQGFNPRDLLLDKVVRAPGGPVAQVITPVEVSYEEKTTLKYDSVTILPDGVTVRVDETS